MKFLKESVAGMLAALAVMSCSTENTTPDDSGENSGKAYMSVNLAMVGGVSSKAEGDYENGTAAESAVDINNSAFLFYDGNGHYLTYGTIAADDVTNVEDGKLILNDQKDGNTVSHKSNAVIVLGPTKSKPAYVLAVLNYKVWKNLENQSMNTAINTVVDDKLGAEAGDFVMTNSSYMSTDDEKGQIVNATAIADENIADTKDKALEKPVSIYVERLVSKITMTPNTNLANKVGDKYYFPMTDGEYILDGKHVSARVVVDGWCVNAFNASGYLVKKLRSNWNTNEVPFDGWNSAAEHRCFWSADMNYSTDNGDNDNYEFGKDPQTGTYAGLQYRSWNDATKAKLDYYYPNTVKGEYQQGKGGDKTNVTTMLIAAHVEFSADGENWKAQDLYYKNGVYYTDATLKKNLMESLSDYEWRDSNVSNDGEQQYWSSSLDPAELNWVFASSGHNTSDLTILIDGATCKNEAHKSAKLYKKSTNAVATIATLSADVQNSNFAKNIKGLKDGAIYYQVPVEHLGTNDKAKSVNYGVVRNHVYKLTLSNILRLGNPVYDKDEKLVIIPGKEQNYYVAAELNILAWKVVSQDVVID